MSGPTTDIEIMSNAAVLLGRASFTTIVDSNEFAVSLQMFYNMLVASELAKNIWKFSMKIVQVSQVAAFDPDFAYYNTAYDLPADFLAMVRVYPDIPYQIFGRRMYCTTQGKLQIQYTHEVPVTYWSAPFKEYMVYALASKLAPSVCENVQMTQIMMVERDKAKAIAMFVDSQNSPSVPIQSNPWREVRYNGGVGWYGSAYGGLNGWG